MLKHLYLQTAVSHPKAHGIHVDAIGKGCSRCLPIVLWKYLHKWSWCVLILKDYEKKDTNAPGSQNTTYISHLHFIRQSGIALHPYSKNLKGISSHLTFEQCIDIRFFGELHKICTASVYEGCN